MARSSWLRSSIFHRWVWPHGLIFPSWISLVNDIQRIERGGAQTAPIRCVSCSHFCCSSWFSFTFILGGEFYMFGHSPHQLVLACCIPLILKGGILDFVFEPFCRSDHAVLMIFGFH